MAAEVAQLRPARTLGCFLMAEQDQPSTAESGHDEPPGRAFARVAQFVESTVDATFEEHGAAVFALAIRNNPDVREAISAAAMEVILGHEWNFHGRGPQAFDAYGLVEQLERDGDLCRQLLAVLKVARNSEDEPPVRAIGSVTGYVNRVADDAASAAIARHEESHHARAADDEPPAGRLYPLVRLIGETVEEAIDVHKRDCHSGGAD
jgi:hypothetical protein